jgi:hypothetical protein
MNSLPLKDVAANWWFASKRQDFLQINIFLLALPLIELPLPASSKPGGVWRCLGITG